MTEALMVPTVHLNGTSRAELERQLDEAVSSLREAIGKVNDAAPNGRDYYVQGADATSKAVAQHNHRIDRLNGVLNELAKIWEGVVDQQ